MLELVSTPEEALKGSCPQTEACEIEAIPKPKQSALAGFKPGDHPLLHGALRVELLSTRPKPDRGRDLLPTVAGSREWVVVGSAGIGASPKNGSPCKPEALFGPGLPGPQSNC